MLLTPAEIVKKTRRLQQRHQPTEARWQDVRAARNGDLDQVFPDAFSEDWPKPVIANFIDTVARDLAEILAPLPSFNCSSATMASDKARRFADRRTKIAQNYLVHSRLAMQMQYAADHYFTYGAAVFYIEPDYEARLPRIVSEEPLGGYPEWDRWGRLRSYAKRFYSDSDQLCEMFPEADGYIRKAADKTKIPGVHPVEIIRYCDKDQISLILVGSTVSIPLVQVANRLGETPVVIVQKPGLDFRTPKGNFDDVVWVQIARDVLAKLHLEATTKAVQAPLAMPHDVQEINTGPDAILRTANPQQIRRVGLEMSPAAFTESQALLEEMRQGTRYPAARTGGVDGSIVTGRGVQALMGGFDTQIKAGQVAFQQSFVDMMRLCFTMDEKLWPNRDKAIRGAAAGTPYDFTYRPARDINGDYMCEVSYGFASGLDPNRAVVMLLQLRAEKVFSRDYFARQLPFDININEEFTKVDVEESREALKQSIYGYVQAIPALAQSGQDPSEAVHRMTMIVKGLQAGKAIEDVVQQAFAPRPVQPPPGVGEVPGGGGGNPGDGGGPGMGGGGTTGGLTDSGLMRGVAPGQAGEAPGGRPDLNVMLAGLSGNGQPQMSSFLMKRRRI